MAQKFIGLEDAATQLGVPKEKLNELREAGQLRAYRDGASWKFRSEEIDELAKTGLPAAEESALGMAPLNLDDELELDLDSSSGDELELGSLDLEESGEAAPDTAGASDLDLTIDEPTVPADEPEETLSVEFDDDDLVLDTEASGDDAESILLSPEELGGAPGRPPSTIIGKTDQADDDLELSPSDSVAGMSDVRLAEDAGEVLSDEAAGSEIIPGAGAPPSGKFEDLEELEIDLEVESSRILEADDVAAARAAMEDKPADSSGESDLALAPSDSDANLSGLSSLSSDEEASDVSLTGISSLDVSPDSGNGGGSSLAGLSAIELADDEDDDFVLGDSGSDLTLSGADSGINLTPSDSGISLEDASQILGGSAMGSSIDLGEIASGIDASGSIASGELASSEEFLLTPAGDDDDEEDSSQVIALDAVEEVAESEDALLGDAVAMDLDGDDASLAPAAVAPVAAEAAFSVWNVAGLGACLSVMTLCGIMMVDIVRSIWAWEEPTSTSSALINGLLETFGR